MASCRMTIMVFFFFFLSLTVCMLHCHVHAHRTRGGHHWTEAPSRLALNGPLFQHHNKADDVQQAFFPNTRGTQEDAVKEVEFMEQGDAFAGQGAHIHLDYPGPRTHSPYDPQDHDLKHDSKQH